MKELQELKVVEIEEDYKGTEVVRYKARPKYLIDKILEDLQ